MGKKITANRHFQILLENHELKRLVILRGYVNKVYGDKAAEVTANFFSFQTMIQGRNHKSI